MRVPVLIFLKNLRESCSRRSATLGIGSTIQRANVLRHVLISVTVDDPESSPLYSFNLVNLSFREQVIPNRGRIFHYRSLVGDITVLCWSRFCGLSTRRSILSSTPVLDWYREWEQ